MIHTPRLVIAGRYSGVGRTTIATTLILFCPGFAERFVDYCAQWRTRT